MKVQHSIALSLPLALTAVLLSERASAQSLVEYDPTGTQASGNPVFPTSVAPSVTASDLTQVGFVGGWGNTDVWPVGQLGVASTMLDPFQYVTFDVHPSASIQCTALSYFRRSYTGEGNRQAAVRTSLDGFTNDVDVVTGLPAIGDVQIDFDLTSLAATANPITFRVYFYDAPTTGIDWVDLVSSNAGGTGLILTGNAGGLGTPYCSAVANSTGQPGSISGQGFNVVSLNDVTLTASSLPQNSFGFFLTSQTQGFVSNPGGSQGDLCLAGSIGRYVGPGQIQNSGAPGSFSLVLDLTQHPTPVGFVSVMPGETWNFQAWYRDAVMGSATSNFTSGLEVGFQ